MKKASPSLSLDWLALTVRWAFLLGVSIWLNATDSFTTPIIIMLAVMGVGNLAFSILAGLNKEISFQNIWGVVGDVLAAHTLYFMIMQSGTAMFWLGLLPLVTAALYHRWIGVTILIPLNLLIQGALAWSTFAQPEVYFILVILLVFYIVVGAPLAYLVPFLSAAKPPPAKAQPASQVGISGMDRERRSALFELINELNSSLNFRKLVETCLAMTFNALEKLNVPTEKLVSTVLIYSADDDKQPELQIASSRHLYPSDAQVKMAGTQGVLGKVIEEDRATTIKDIRSDPELNRLMTLRKCRTAFCFPLRTGRDAHGALLFAHPEVDFFSPDRLEVFNIVGSQLVNAMQNARLYLDLEQEKERMMEIQDESRKKLSRDLHDGPTQSIAAIAMRVNFARRLMDRDIKAASEELFKIEELARRTTKEIRHMLFALRPLVLESQGLIAALESMAEKMKETFGQNVTIQADGRVVEALEPSKHAVIFFIAEEAVNNARKHAQAEQIWVRLKMLKDGISLLEIEDNGIGFNVRGVESAYESRGSLGMVNMRERTELVNGLLRIDSAPGRGTRVQVAIPLTPEAMEKLRRGI